MAPSSHLHSFEGNKLDDANLADTETLDDIMDSVFYDTEVIHDQDYVENSETELLGGYDTEIVPDSDDETVDTGHSRGFQSASVGFVGRLASDLSKVKFASLFAHKQLDLANQNNDMCGDQRHSSGQTSDMAVCLENELNLVTVQSGTQTAELQFQHTQISRVNNPHLSGSVSFGINCCDDSKKLSEGTEVDENGKQLQLKRKEISLVYTRRKKRLCNSVDNGVGEVMRSTNDNNGYGGLSYVESQEPEDVSGALLFVDQFVCDNVMPLHSPITTAIMRDKSPPALSAKGTQKLVRWPSVRNTVEKPGIFEWDESVDGDRGHIHSVNKVQQSCRDIKFKQTYVRRSPSVFNVVSMELESPHILRQNNVKGFNSNDCLRNLTHSHASLAVFDNMYSASTRKIIEEEASEVSDKVLGWQGNEKSPLTELEGDTLQPEPEHVSDVGLGTQMAAEAMQALSCSASADCQEVGSNPHEIPHKSVGENQKKIGAGVLSIPKKARSSSRCISGQPKNTEKVHCSVYGKDTLKVSKPITRRKSGKFFAGQCKDERKYEISWKAKMPKKKKANGAEVVTVNVPKENVNLSVSVEDEPLSRLKLRRKVRDIRPVTAKSSLFNVTGSLVGESIGRGVGDIKVGPYDKRKDTDRSGKMLEDASPMEKHSVISCIDSISVQNLKLCHQRILALSRNWYPRDYPRGKRTCRGIVDRLEGSSVLGYSTVKDNYPFRTQLNTNCSGSSASQFSMKKKQRSSVYISPCWLSSQKSETSRGASGNKPRINNMVFGSVCDVWKKTSPEQPTDSTITMQPSKSNNIVSVSTMDDASLKGNEHPISRDSVSPSCPPATNEHLSSYSASHYEQLGMKKPSPTALTRELVRLGFRGSMPELSSTSSRRRKTMANIRVLLSQNLDEDTQRHQKKILIRLGVPLASCSSDATHFVADKFARTRNMLEFIAHGKPVVTHMWLESCEQAGFYIDEKNYILRDVKKEQKFGFKLPLSLDRARQHPILKGYTVFVTPNTKPGKEVLASLVKAVSGQVVDVVTDPMLKDKMVLENLLILSCEEDQACCTRFLQAGAAAYSPEMLLNGIVTQKLEFKGHKLFTNANGH